MLSMFARKWWAVALQGLAAVIFGVLTLVWPQSSLGALVIVFGAFAMADGTLALIAGLAARLWGAVLAGIVGIAVGILTLVYPNVTGLALLYFIAAWAVITGVFEIAAAIELRHVIDGEWMMVLNGILSVVFGVLLVAFPGAGALSLAWLIGAFAIISGIMLIVLAFRLRRLQKAAGKVADKLFEDLN
jgi:uncharacterized membrane protein HdeD (DUF308 family)